MGLEPTTVINRSCFQDSVLIRPGDFRRVQAVKDQNVEHRAGIEPASPRYDGGILPLEDQCLFR